MHHLHEKILLAALISVATGCATTDTIKPMHTLESGQVAVAGQVQAPFGEGVAFGASATVGIADVMDFTLSGLYGPRRDAIAIGGGPRFYLSERLLLDLEFDLHHEWGEVAAADGFFEGLYYTNLDWLVTRQALAYTFPGETVTWYVGGELDQSVYLPFEEVALDEEDSRFDEAQFTAVRLGALAGLEAEIAAGLSLLAQVGVMMPVVERRWATGEARLSFFEPFQGDSDYARLAPHAELGLYYEF